MKPQDGPPDLILLAPRGYPDLAARARPNLGIAVRAGSVIAIGTRRALCARRGRHTRVLDLQNACFTPGTVDAHTHFFYWALARAWAIDLHELTSLNTALSRIHSAGPVKRVGDWVLGLGFDHNRWGTPFPTARQLDLAVPSHPALIRSRDGHSVWLNSLGLRRAGITRTTPDPPGGRYLRDENGAPTGIVQEAAIDLLPNPMREFAQSHAAAAHRRIDRALHDAYRHAWAHGFVGVHSMDDGPSLAHLQRHALTNQLGLRVVHAVPLADLDHATALGLRSGFGNDWLQIGGVKIFADGALGSQTAYMFDPYPGRGRYCGIPVIAGHRLRDALVQAARHGWVGWIHAIGDRAVHEVIDAVAAARRVATLPLPYRIEHAQCVRPADVRRMARLGIVASVQPCHILGDIPTAQCHWPQAQRNAYPLRRLIDAGVTLAGGSDVPIERLDVRRSLFGAMQRTDPNGAPAGGWFPAQRLTARGMLLAHTAGAAAAAGRKPPWGTLRPGAPADITIWAEDPLRAPADKLLEIGILGCVVGGKIHLADVE